MGDYNPKISDDLINHEGKLHMYKTKEGNAENTS